METINFTSARKNLSSVLDSVAEDSDYTIITRGNKPDSVVMSLKSFNGMMETMHLLSSPANAEHVMESIAQHKAGFVSPRQLIDLDNA